MSAPPTRRGSPNSDGDAVSTNREIDLRHRDIPETSRFGCFPYAHSDAIAGNRASPMWVLVPSSRTPRDENSNRGHNRGGPPLSATTDRDRGAGEQCRDTATHRKPIHHGRLHFSTKPPSTHLPTSTNTARWATAIPPATGHGGPIAQRPRPPHARHQPGTGAPDRRTRRGRTRQHHDASPPGRHPPEGSIPPEKAHHQVPANRAKPPE